MLSRHRNAELVSPATLLPDKLPTLDCPTPHHRMPWVFTYNDWSAGTEYDYMVKAAVTSGIEVARMKPYCMYSGSTSAEMYQWFLSKGVTIIQVTGVRMWGSRLCRGQLHHQLVDLLSWSCRCSTSQRGGMP